MMTRLTLSLTMALFGGALLMSSACAKEESAPSASVIAASSTQAVQAFPNTISADWRELDRIR